MIVELVEPLAAVYVLVKLHRLQTPHK